MCEGLVVRRDDDEPHAVEVVVVKRFPAPLDTGVAGQLLKPRGEGLRDQDQPRAGSQQQSGLGFGRVRATDEQAGLSSESQENRQVVHVRLASRRR